MNYENCLTKLCLLMEDIRKELHTQNVLAAERNKVLEYYIPCGCNPSIDLLPRSREFLKREDELDRIRKEAGL